MTTYYNQKIVVCDYQDVIGSANRARIKQVLLKKGLSEDEVSVFLYRVNSGLVVFEGAGEIRCDNRVPGESRPDYRERYERIIKAFQELKKNPDYIYRYLGARYLDGWESIPYEMFDRIIKGCQEEVRKDYIDNRKDGMKSDAINQAVFQIVLVWKEFGLTPTPSRKSNLHEVVLCALYGLLRRNDFYEALKLAVKKAESYSVSEKPNISKTLEYMRRYKVF